MNQEFLHNALKSGITHVGLPWYEAHNFDAVMRIMVDKQKLHSTHAAWLASSMGTEQNIRAAGLIPVRAILQPDTFISFCQAHGLRLDAHGRNKFANAIAAKNVRAGE